MGKSFCDKEMKGGKSWIVVLTKQKVRRKSLGDNELNENLCYHKRVNIFAIFFKHIFTLLKERKNLVAKNFLNMSTEHATMKLLVSAEKIIMKL